MLLALLLTLLEDKTDEEKFILLYKKYRSLMLKVAYDHVHDYFLAEDCVQNAFCDIAKNFNKVDDINSKRTLAYVVIITKTCSIKMYNSENKNDAVAIDDLAFDIKDDNLCEDEFFKKFDINSVMNAISTLPEGYREPLLLRYVHNYEYDNIGRLMGISQANVRKRIQRAKQMVKNTLLSDDLY